MEYERAIEDLKARLRQQQQAFIWAMVSLMDELCPYDLKAEVAKPASSPERRQLREKEFKFLCNNASMLLWRPRSAEEQARVDNMAKSLHQQMGEDETMEVDDKTEKETATKQIEQTRTQRPKTFDPFIVESYQYLLGLLEEMRKHYASTLPEECEKLELALWSASFASN